MKEKRESIRGWGCPLKIRRTSPEASPSVPRWSLLSWLHFLPSIFVDDRLGPLQHRSQPAFTLSHSFGKRQARLVDEPLDVTALAQGRFQHSSESRHVATDKGIDPFLDTLSDRVPSRVPSLRPECSQHGSHEHMVRSRVLRPANIQFIHVVYDFWCRQTESILVDSIPPFHFRFIDHCGVISDQHRPSFRNHLRHDPRIVVLDERPFGIRKAFLRDHDGAGASGRGSGDAARTPAAHPAHQLQDTGFPDDPSDGRRHGIRRLRSPGPDGARRPSPRARGFDFKKAHGFDRPHPFTAPAIRPRTK